MQYESPKLFLEGTWKGKGRVIDSLDYNEELEFTRIKPNVYFYRQKTANEAKGPLHSEVGYVRVFKDANEAEGKIELAVTHPFGVAEISEGTFSDNKATLKTASIARTSSAIAPYVTVLTRVFYLKDDNTLTYTVDMGTSTKEECPHLEGELKRV